MTPSLNSEIISLAKEITGLPKSMVTSSIQRNAYRNVVDTVVKTTRRTDYIFNEPPIEHIMKFFALYCKSTGVPMATQVDVLEEIELAKLYNPFEPKRILRAINDYGSPYKMTYLTYHKPSKGHAILLTIEEKTLFGDPNRNDYNDIEI